MNKSERFAQQLAQFDRALSKLKVAVAENETEIVRDAMIQRFEFTFEMAWKVLFRLLKDQGAEVGNKAYLVLPEAFQAGLLGDAELWAQVREYRNLTSHTYDEDTAIKVAAFIRDGGLRAFEGLQARLHGL